MKTIKKHSLCLVIAMLTATSFATHQIDTPNDAEALSNDHSVTWSNTALWQGEDSESQIRETPALDKIFNSRVNSDDVGANNPDYTTGVSNVSGKTSISGWVLIALASLILLNMIGKKSKK